MRSWRIVTIVDIAVGHKCAPLRHLNILLDRLGAVDHLSRSLFNNSAANLFLHPELLLNLFIDQLLFLPIAFLALNLVNTLTVALCECFCALVALYGHLRRINTELNFKRLSMDSFACFSDVAHTFVAPVKFVKLLVPHLAASLADFVVSLCDFLDRKEEVVPVSARESEGLLAVGAAELLGDALSMHELGTFVTELNIVLYSVCFRRDI